MLCVIDRRTRGRAEARGAGNGAAAPPPRAEERGRSRRQRRRAARGGPARPGETKAQGEPGAERGPGQAPGRTGGGGARRRPPRPAGGARTRATGERRRRQAEAEGRSPEGRTAGRAGRPGGADGREQTAEAPRGPPNGGSTGQAAGCPPDRHKAGRGEGPHRYETRTRNAEKQGRGVAPSSLGIVLILLRHNFRSRFVHFRPESHRRKFRKKGVDKTALRVVQCLLPRQNKIPNASL